MKCLSRLLVLTSILLSILIQPVSAQNLCEPSCELIIDFTNGGSIEAIEDLTIIFGDGGFINDGAVTTGYASGSTLQLNAGDDVEISAGGELNLGNAGNIVYTVMDITANGNMAISAVQGGVVSLQSNSSFNVSGELVLNSALNLSGELDLSGSPDPASPGNVTVMSGTGFITVDPGSAGNIILSNNQFITPSTSTLSINEVNQLQAQNTAVINPPPVNVTPINLADTITLDSSLNEIPVSMEGLTLPTEDGKECTVRDRKCIDSEGNSYSMVGGKLILPNNSSGGINPVNLLFLFLVLIFSGFRRSL